MSTKKIKSLLIVNNTIVDISGCVQNIEAHCRETGELKCRGNGIILYRPNHKDGNAPTFLAYKGKEFIFGEWVIIYNTCVNWSALDYNDYTMSGSDMEQWVNAHHHFIKTSKR